MRLIWERVGDDMAWSTITRRQYLTMKAIEGGAGIFGAIEAVATTALEHPEWDMAELKTWPEWEGRTTSST